MDLSPASPKDAPFSIIADTKHWIGVNKRAGVLIHPSKPSDRRTLWDYLKELLAFEIAAGGTLSILNRLDRETSGVVLAAKTREAAGALGRVMKERRMRKEYTAIVWGWPEDDTFEIDEPLTRLGKFGESHIWLKQGVHSAGLTAKTKFQVESRFERSTTNGCRFALVRAFPETGRTHQIRVHLAHAGFPVVGDKLYGPDANLYLEFIETGWTAHLESKLLLSRHALHSSLLAWTKPDGQEQVLLAPLPEDFKDFAGAQILEEAIAPEGTLLHQQNRT
jgi:23S rRNA pseudouridine1911/1915/1917 synthase